MKLRNIKSLFLAIATISLSFSTLHAEKAVTITNASSGRVTFIKYDIFGNYQHYPLDPGKNVQINIKNDPYINLLALEDDKNVPYFFLPGDNITVINVTHGFYALVSGDAQRTREFEVSLLIFEAMQKEFLWKQPFENLRETGNVTIDSVVAQYHNGNISERFRRLTHTYYAYDLLMRKLRNGAEDMSVQKVWNKDFDPMMTSLILSFRSYVLNHLSKQVAKDKMLDEVHRRYGGIAREIALYTTMHMAFYRDKGTFRSQYHHYRALSSDNVFKDKLSYFKLTDEMSGSSDRVTLVAPQGDTVPLKRVLETLKGKVVLIDLWASWCVPCLEQLPFSNALTEKFSEKSFQVLYLSMDRELQLFKDASGKYLVGKLNYNILSNFTSPFATLHKITALPRYMLIDKQGNLVATKTPYPADKALQEMIERYL